MNYRLKKLASGACDALLGGEAIASLVKVPHGRSAYGVIELLDETDRPAPFVHVEHVFPSLDQAKAFLGMRPDAPPGAKSVGFPVDIELGEAA